MRDTIELAREAGGDDWGLFKDFMPEIERLVALVRADERNLWPAEMEAMERQVNILTDALADEREACAKVCDDLAVDAYNNHDILYEQCAAAIRARSKDEK